MWNHVRKLSGVSKNRVSGTAPWISQALASPKRAPYKEDIRHFFGLLSNIEPACRQLATIGGMYDWKQVN